MPSHLNNLNWYKAETFKDCWSKEGNTLWKFEIPSSSCWGVRAFQRFWNPWFLGGFEIGGVKTGRASSVTTRVVFLGCVASLLYSSLVLLWPVLCCCKWKGFLHLETRTVIQLVWYQQLGRKMKTRIKTLYKHTPKTGSGQLLSNFVIFTESAPFGQFSHRVVMSVCVSVTVQHPLQVVVVTSGQRSYG